jgi:biotin-(acetyl-CoA carboxylase) ligase
MEQWRRMSDIIGRQVYVDVMGTRHCGTVTAVDDDGVLILEDAEGQTRRIFSGDVTRVRA